jgi:phosphohistidine phosphatase
MTMTKILYLLRHAKSSWDDPGLDDFDRPLAPRGEDAARAMAGHVERAGIAPHLVLCSPAQRTMQTIDRVRRGLPPSTDVRIEDGLYRAGRTEILRMLRLLPADLPSVMVVGHNPLIRDLTLALAGSGAAVSRVTSKFPTGALAQLTFPVDDWNALAAGGGELTAFVIPKDL